MKKKTISITIGARAIGGTGVGRYNPGTGPIYFDEVRCTGSETALVNCSSRGRGEHNCDHSEDAGVKCEGMYEKHHTLDNTEVTFYD